MHGSNTYTENVVQQLFECAVRTFSKPADQRDREEKLAEIISIMEEITAEDLGLQEYMVDTNANVYDKINSISIVRRRRAPITYIHVVSISDLFSIGIFVIPRGCSIPLHDHPNMTVLTKLLFGSVKITSFDWLSSSSSSSDNHYSSNSSNANAKTVHWHDIKQGPCHLSTLFPDHGGNIHTLEALTTCAIFDILAPPYDKRHGRPCNYYQCDEQQQQQPTSEQSLTTTTTTFPKSVHLTKCRSPADFFTVDASYKGLPIDLSVFQPEYNTAYNNL